MTETQTAYLPPHDADAERYVLSACLTDAQAVPRAVELLGAEDFYKGAHRLIFNAVQSLFERGLEVDVLTVSDALRKRKALDDAGGPDALFELEGVAPTGEAVGHHANIIRRKRILRALIGAGHEIARLALEGGSDEMEILDRAEQAVFRVSQERGETTRARAGDVLPDVYEHVAGALNAGSGVTGLATGFLDLDRLTAGFQDGNLIVIAARPSMGKTALALNILEFMAVKQGMPCALFSLEMSKEEAVERLLCSVAKVNLGRVRTGIMAGGDWGKLTDAGGALAEAPLWIDDAGTLSTMDLRARARRMKSEHGVRCIAVDYLQLLHVSGKSESRQLEISEISRSLKAIAKDLGIPVIALSQLSRAVESRQDKRPMLSDLRESGSIEQDADVVMFIYRDAYYNPECEEPNAAEILVRKQRSGATGDLKLYWSGELTRFANIKRMEGAQ